MNPNLAKIVELIKKNQFIEARKECLILINNKCDDPEIYNVHAITCFQLDDHENAIKSWKKSIELKPKYFVAFNNIGKALLSLKRFEEALENFNKTISIKPDFFEAFNNKGNTLVRLSRFVDAIKNYNKAIEINPNNPLSYIFKGHALSVLDELENALHSYQKAYDINADHPFLFGYILNIKAQICDWREFDKNMSKLKFDLENKKKSNIPFYYPYLIRQP